MKLDWPLLMVEWEDPSTSNLDWTCIGDIDLKHRVRCVSVGFLLHETRRFIVLLPHIGNLDRNRQDQQTWGSIRIPTGCITKRKVLISTSSRA